LKHECHEGAKGTNLVGNDGTAFGNSSIRAVRDSIAIYINGSTPMNDRADLQPRTWSLLTLAPVPTIALTIYLRDTHTETGITALSGDQPNGGMIYQEGKFVYGEAAVQIGDTVYRFDKPEIAPGEPEKLPEPWRAEFEFKERLVARTGNQAGFHPNKAQFWVGGLDSNSAVGQEDPYSLTMKLYEGDELRESLQVFFAVADAPEGGGEEGGGGGGFPGGGGDT
jgi:hypothetical protein